MARELTDLQLEVVDETVDAGTLLLERSRHCLHGDHPRIAPGFGVEETPFLLGVVVDEALLDDAVLLRELLLNFIEYGLGFSTHGA